MYKSTMMNIRDTSRYQNGKIYTIRSHQTGDVYIGSTCMPLAKRFHTHKKNYKQWQKGNHSYLTSFEIIKHPDFYIELLEDCKCDTKAQLERREGQLIRETECVNRVISGRNKAERVKQQKNQKHTCDCGGKYTQVNKAIHHKTKKHQKYEQFMSLTEEQVKAMPN